MAYKQLHRKESCKVDNMALIQGFILVKDFILMLNYILVLYNLIVKNEPTF